MCPLPCGSCLPGSWGFFKNKIGSFFPYLILTYLIPLLNSPQSPKGFLESYEEMLSYALRPETWATTRLELEGRGVSWLVLNTWDP